MSYQYEYAMGTENAEAPQQAMVDAPAMEIAPSARGRGTPSPPPPPDPIFPIMPELPEDVANSVKDFTGSELAGTAASCLTVALLPVTFFHASNQFTWPAFVPWIAGLWMYRRRMNQGMEKDAALKSGAKVFLGSATALCAAPYLIFAAYFTPLGRI